MDFKTDSLDMSYYPVSVRINKSQPQRIVKGLFAIEEYATINAKESSTF